jgi:hypothetical protein
MDGKPECFAKPEPKGRTCASDSINANLQRPSAVALEVSAGLSEAIQSPSPQRVRPQCFSLAVCLPCPLGADFTGHCVISAMRGICSPSLANSALDR